MEQHEQQDVAICHHLANLVPLECAILHACVIAADPVDGFDALRFVEKTRLLGGVWEEDDEDDGPSKGDEAEDDEEPL